MNLVGKKIIVTDTVIESRYYKKGEIYTVIYDHNNFGISKGSIIINKGLLLIESEYKVLEEE